MLEIQEFMDSTRSFMNETKAQHNEICKWQDNSTKQVDNQSRMIENLTEMVRALLAKDQASVRPAIPAVLGTPNETDRLSGAGVMEGNCRDRNAGNRRPEVVQDRGGRHSFSGTDDRIGGNRRPEVVQERKLQKVEPNLVEAKSCLQAKEELSRIEPSVEVSIHETIPCQFVQVVQESILDAYNLFDEMPRKKSVVFEPSKVNFDPLPVVFEIASVNMDVVLLADAIEFLEFSYAHKVLEKMSKNDIAFIGSSFHYSLRSIDSPSGFVFDPGKIFDMLLVLLWTIMSKCGPWLSLVSTAFLC